MFWTKVAEEMKHAWFREFFFSETPDDARSKARVCGRSLAGIVGLNLDGGICVCCE